MWDLSFRSRRRRGAAMTATMASAVVFILLTTLYCCLSVSTGVTAAASANTAPRRRNNLLLLDDDDPESSLSSSLSYYDMIRERALDESDATVRVVDDSQYNNPDSSVLRVVVSPGTDTDTGNQPPQAQQEEVFHLAHLTSIMPLRGPSFFRDWSASALLAIQHFNTGNPTVIPLLRYVTGRSGTCKMRLTHEYYDSKRDPIQTAGIFAQDLNVRPNNAAAVTAPDATMKKPRPVAIIGAVRSDVSETLATLTSLAQMPQISHSSTSTGLDNAGLYPYFGRLIPSAYGDANAAVDYLKRKLGVSHVGLLYVRNSYGMAYRTAFQNAASTWGRGGGSAADSLGGDGGGDDDDDSPLIVTAAPFDVELDASDYRSASSSLRSAINRLASTKYRYLYVVCGPEHYEPIMEHATDVSIVGKGYTWLFADAVQESQFRTARYPKGSALADATHGVGLVKVGISRGSLKGRPELESLLDVWEGLNDDAKFGEYFRDAQPGLNDIHTFQTVPSWRPILLYDAVISLGLAACSLEARGNPHFTGPQLFDAFKRTKFEGASGRVEFDPDTGTRLYKTVVYTVSNVVRHQVEEDGNVTFKVYETSAYKVQRRRDDEEGGGGGSSSDASPFGNNGTAPTATGGVTGGGDDLQVEWVPLDGNPPFNYSDLTHTPHPALPLRIEDRNEIGRGVQITCWTLCGMVLLLSVGFAAWTHRSRKNVVVRASQPLFLHMICVGTSLMAMAIVPLSLQEPLGEKGLDAACMSSWWLYAVGFAVTFSALFVKTLRLNRIMRADRFRRVVVTTRDIIKPLLAFLALNLSVLVLWTAIAPLQYKRLAGDAFDEFGRSTESYGRCEYDTESIVFASILLFINFTVLVFANYQAYKGRKINIDFSESRYIAYSMVSMLESWVLGVPIIVVAWESPEATFMVLSCIIFITTSATLLLLFVPKINASNRAKNGARSTSIISSRRWTGQSSSGGNWSSQRHSALSRSANGELGGPCSSLQDSTGSTPLRGILRNASDIAIASRHSECSLPPANSICSVESNETRAKKSIKFCPTDSNGVSIKPEAEQALISRRSTIEPDDSSDDDDNWDDNGLQLAEKEDNV